jgi:drug/metabolite transporter (DMT)-like permease
MPRMVLAALIAGSICASAGTVLLKIGATGRTTLLTFFNIWIVVGLVLYGLGAAFWIYGMSKLNLIAVYPFTVLSFVLVYCAGVFLLGEIPTRTAVAGVLLVLLGLYLVARGST